MGTVFSFHLLARAGTAYNCGCLTAKTGCPGRRAMGFVSPLSYLGAECLKNDSLKYLFGELLSTRTPFIETMIKVWKF